MRAPGLETIRLLPARCLVLLVRLYQGSLARYLGGQCRYQPSCSEYFVQALDTHGAIRGAAMGVWRILRCHPLAKGGYDPVRHLPVKENNSRQNCAQVYKET